MKKLISLVLVLVFLFALSVPAAAADDATGTTLRLEETNGTVTVKDSAGKDKTAREGMRLYSGYTVSTGASSSAYISLDDTKAVKLDSSGKVEIKKQGKKLEVSLTSGQLFFNVTEPLKTDESLNIRTATMVTGIRGSFGWVNPRQLGLMHGHVTLTCVNPETSETRVTEVYSGEKVSYEQGTAQAADPDLLEIDFVKEEVTIEDVPAIVVEQVAHDETLQTQLEEVETIDVTELVESLETKQTEEAAEEAAAQAEVETQLAAQEETIAAAAAEEGSADGTAQEYADLSANTTPASTGGDSGGSVTTSGTATSIDQISALFSTYDVVTYTGVEYEDILSVLEVPSGKTLYIGDGSARAILHVKTLLNHGTIVVRGGSSEGSQFALDIPADNASYNYTGAVITIENDGALFISAEDLSSAEFTNQGTINNRGDITVYQEVTFHNYGAINN